MDEINRFRRAAVAWAAVGSDASAATDARALAAGIRTVVLVEGTSDQVAVEALAVRRGRDLAAERIAVVPLGGAMSIGRFLDVLGPRGLNLPLAGLCDAAEERFFRRGLERAGVSVGTGEGLASLGFFLCSADLEDELIRALGIVGVERAVEELGHLRLLRTFQNQPAQRVRTIEQQLHRFMGTTSGRKSEYARALVAGLDLDRVPPPLDRLLDFL